MSRKINNTLTESDLNANNRHRKEKSRNSRGTLRPEVQVPGNKTRKRRRSSDKPGNSSQVSSRPSAEPKQQTKRSSDQLGDRNNSNPYWSTKLSSNPLRPKISERQAEAMLTRIAKEHLLNNSNAIITIDDEIHAFGRYTIKKKSSFFEVYRSATLIGVPSSKQVALSWCVADKYNKTQLAQELLIIDQELERKNSEILFYEHTIKITTDSEKKYVVSDRLRQAKALQKYLTERLEECVNLAKYWQQKGFRDETARIRIKNQSTAKPESI